MQSYYQFSGVIFFQGANKYVANWDGDFFFPLIRQNIIAAYDAQNPRLRRYFYIIPSALFVFCKSNAANKMPRKDTAYNFALAHPLVILFIHLPRIFTLHINHIIPFLSRPGYPVVIHALLWQTCIRILQLNSLRSRNNRTNWLAYKSPDAFTYADIHC